MGSRRDIRSERGFTLIEVLVVVLVIGIVASIALPVFFQQRSKAQDASAKALARTGANAVQAYEAAAGTYLAAPSDVLEIAPELGQAVRWDLFPAADTFQIRVTSRSGGWFEIGRYVPEGPLERHCSTAGSGGCGALGTW